MSKTPNLPHKVKMCSSCPFNKSSKTDWRTLPDVRVLSILNANTFVCHKTAHDSIKNRKQCYGHMKMFPDTNLYVRYAALIEQDLKLKEDDRLFTLPELLEYYGFRREVK